MTSTQTALCISLSFLGGAAAGAAAVYASNPDNRKKMRNTFETSRRMASRVPEALHDVKTIATDALVEARDSAKDAMRDAGQVAQQVLATSPALRNGPRVA